MFAFSEDESVLSEAFGLGMLAGLCLLKAVVRNYWTELWASDNVSEYGVSASEYCKE